MVDRDESIVVRTAVRILVPLIQLTGLYVFAHGHISPGGGFQGGCIFASSLILMAISLGMDEVRRRLGKRLCLVLIGLGAFIFAATGMVSIILGGEYLNYGYLDKLLPFDTVTVRYYSIALVELGVQLTVTGSMLYIFHELVNFKGETKREKQWSS